MKNAMMEAALKYAKANIPVMPLHLICEDGSCSCNKGQKCDSKGKHPLYSGWYKNSTTDTQQIVRWWTIKPNANIGIPTGEKSGWLVLDVDDGGGATLAELEATNGKLPDTVTAITGSGGKQALQTKITVSGVEHVTTTKYVYDNNGNQVTTTVNGTVTVTNTYDNRNQLIKTVTGDNMVENGYNGEGYRVEKTTNGKLTRYLYEYDKVVLEVDEDSNQIGRNIYGTNLLVRSADGLDYYYMYNGHADVTALLKTEKDKSVASKGGLQTYHTRSVIL